MLQRTRHATLVFRRPFAMKGWPEPQPAGTYAVDTDEELIEGLSFPAYRRVSTTITRQVPGASAFLQAIPVDPVDLDRAHAADAAADGEAHGSP